MKKATKRQIMELLCNDPINLVDAIGLDVGDVQLTCPKNSRSSLHISVRPGLKYKVPEEISVIIDGVELLVNFELDEEFHDDTPSSTIPSNS